MANRNFLHVSRKEGEVNALDFLDFILEKHHGGYFPEDDFLEERDPG